MPEGWGFEGVGEVYTSGFGGGVGGPKRRGWGGGMHCTGFGDDDETFLGRATQAGEKLRVLLWVYDALLQGLLGLLQPIAVMSHRSATAER